MAAAGLLEAGAVFEPVLHGLAAASIHILRNGRL
jgi:hypothetical protein